MDSKQPDITREKILQAAYCEIHRHGFQAASLSAILADTGLTKGALYHHFANKHELGLAVVDEVIGATLEAQVFRPLRESADPIRTLLQILDNRGYGIPAEEVALGCPLNNLMQEMSPVDEVFKTRLSAVLARWRDGLIEALQRGQAQGTIRSTVDCPAAALFILSAWEGCYGVAKNLQSGDALDACLKQLYGYVTSLMN